MYKIICLDNKVFEPDLFETFEEAVQMVRWFIQDDSESITEPERTYGVVDNENNILCVIKNDTYIDLKKFKCAI